MSKKTIFITILSLVIILTGCGQKSYDSKPGLSPEVRKQAEDDLAKYSKLIAEFKPTVAAPATTTETTSASTPAPEASTPTTPAKTPDAKVKAPADDSSKYPSIIWYIGKSTAESTLGKNDTAIITLKDALSKYPDDNVLLNNIGKIYDFANDCSTAETYYKKLIEKYGFNQYYYDLALCYMHSKDKDNTIKNYDTYKKATPNFSDGEIDDFLNK